MEKESKNTWYISKKKLTDYQIDISENDHA